MLKLLLVISISVSILLFFIMTYISSKPQVQHNIGAKMSEPNNTDTVSITVAEEEKWHFVDTEIGDIDTSLRIIKDGEEVIRFEFPDKKVIGMDGRIIGYLNDEEVGLLQNFFTEEE